MEGRGGSRRFRIPRGDRTRADLFNRLQGGPTPVRPLNCSASTSFQKMKNKVRSYLRVVPRSHARGRAGGRADGGAPRQGERERKKEKNISLLFPLMLSSLLHPFLYPWQVIISPINPASFIPRTLKFFNREGESHCNLIAASPRRAFYLSVWSRNER